MLVTFVVAVETAVAGVGRNVGITAGAGIGDPEDSVGKSEKDAHSVPHLRGRVLVDPDRIWVEVFLWLAWVEGASMYRWAWGPSRPSSFEG